MIVNKKSFLYFSLFTDILIIFISFYLSVLLHGRGTPLLPQNLNIWFILSIVWLISAYKYKLIEDHRARTFATVLVSLVRIILIQVILLVIIFFLVKGESLDRREIIYYALTLFVLISLKYWVGKLMLSFVRKHGKNLRHILMIGGGKLGQSFISNVRNHPDYGYDFVGYLDDVDKEMTNIKYLGVISELEEVLNSKEIDDVIIALPNYAAEKINQIIHVCNRNGIRTRIIPDFHKFLSGKFSVSIFGDLPIITIHTEPLDEVLNRFTKRIFDIIFSLLAVIFILSWLTSLIALFNYFYSRGPVFFKQKRVGKLNQLFICYKYRSMHIHECSKDNEFNSVTENDPRVSKIGALLRKTSLDELPQFINVLKGEMSVVGPRPHAIAWDNQYQEYVDELKLRHRVKPGITGWAQIHGFRGDVEDEEENKIRTQKRIDMDLWYIENWSFFLDIQIIISTAWKVLRGDPNAR